MAPLDLISDLDFVLFVLLLEIYSKRAHHLFSKKGSPGPP